MRVWRPTRPQHQPLAGAGARQSHQAHSCIGAGAATAVTRPAQRRSHGFASARSCALQQAGAGQGAWAVRRRPALQSGRNVPCRPGQRSPASCLAPPPRQPTASGGARQQALGAPCQCWNCYDPHPCQPFTAAETTARQVSAGGDDVAGPRSARGIPCPNCVISGIVSEGNAKLVWGLCGSYGGACHGAAHTMNDMRLGRSE